MLNERANELQLYQREWNKHFLYNSIQETTAPSVCYYNMHAPDMCRKTVFSMDVIFVYDTQITQIFTDLKCKYNDIDSIITSPY